MAAAMRLTGTRFVKQTAVCSAVPACGSRPRHGSTSCLFGSSQCSHVASHTGTVQNSGTGTEQAAPSHKARSVVVAAAADVAETAIEARDFAIAMAKIADDTKATDLSVLHVAPLVSWTSYMVICTVMSRPQLLAVLARMEDAAKDDWSRTKQNSAGSSQWEVMDFGDVVVHVFTAEQREHYDLDGFYAAAEEVPLPFVEDWERSGSSNAPESSKKRSAVANAVWSKNLLSL